MPKSSPLRPVIRRLWPSDAAAVESYFLRLDPETRASRFMGTLSDTAALAYARQALKVDGVVFGGFVDGTLRALGELRPSQTPPSRYALGAEAEAAFAVERDYRRNGLGHALFRRIAEAARHRGVQDLRVRCLSRNRPMQGLAARVGADLHMAGGESEGALHLPRPTPASLWRESVTEAFDFTLALAAA
jgi:GNAT superfamily N-acetyltransferase